MKNISTFAKDFKFCPECGSSFKKLKGNLFKCPNDHHFYINPRPTTGVILENEKKEILLVERGVNPKKGYWDIPGGFVDLFETAEDSLVRELQEELGITLSNCKYFSSKYDSYKYRTLNYPSLGLVYQATIKKQEFSASDDISGYKWFNKNKIPYNKLAFDSLREILKEYTSQ